MQGRERCQALQARLIAARAAEERGDRESALTEITAALDIDPHFLVAQALRERLLSGDPIAKRAFDAVPTLEPDQPDCPVSADPYATFQQRAKRRRVDGRIEAARIAIERRRLKEAAAALEEAVELDPNRVELSELTTALEALRRATPSHRGPWIATAVVVGSVLFGASWLRDSSVLVSRSIAAVGPLVQAPAPSVTVTESFVASPVAERQQSVEVPAEKDSGTPSAAETWAAMSSIAAGQLANRPEPPPQPQPMAPLAAPPRLAATIDAPVSTPALPRPESVDESALVRQTLQRYQAAYEGLDAQSAQAVWPGVNQAALARAFDALESQRLTFSSCDVRIQGDTAAATCQGSARYVPKVGSREPRVEPRVWTFTLRKLGSDWSIDSARTQR